MVARRTSTATTVGPDSPQYPDLVRALNARYTAAPRSVHVVDAPRQVRAIVEQAVSANKRLTVRGGGHCLEDFVYNSDVQMIIDLSNMNRVYYDEARNAIAVESGATLLDVYEKLYQTWGVTVPGGICYSVGMGGHVAGGGWGWLVRRDGLIIDHLYGVEVVTVRASGVVRKVVATREADDPPPRPVVGAHRRRRRKLRRRHPLLLPLAGRHRHRPHPPAAQAAVEGAVRGRRLGVGPAEQGQVPPAHPELRQLARHQRGPDQPDPVPEQFHGAQPRLERHSGPAHAGGRRRTQRRNHPERLPDLHEQRRGSAVHQPGPAPMAAGGPPDRHHQPAAQRPDAARGVQIRLHEGRLPPRTRRRRCTSIWRAPTSTTRISASSCRRSAA
ncbi:FAD-binding protein [Nonomuraea salmonea]|uniref:FAD-binding protein n=1 Tax=Nonomuraea salmonea TaxID=46181 RepID=UPI0031E7E51D